MVVATMSTSIKLLSYYWLNRCAGQLSEDCCGWCGLGFSCRGRGQRQGRNSWFWLDWLFFPLLILVSAGAWRVGIGPRLKKCQEGWRWAGLACAVNTHWPRTHFYICNITQDERKHRIYVLTSSCSGVPNKMAGGRIHTDISCAFEYCVSTYIRSRPL